MKLYVPMATWGKLKAKVTLRLPEILGKAKFNWAYESILAITENVDNPSFVPVG